MPHIQLCTVILILAGPVLKTSAQNHHRFLTWSYQDAGNLLKTVGPQLSFFSFAGGVTLASGAWIDEPFQDDVKESYTPGGVWGSYLDMTNELGGPRVRIPIAGLFVATLLTKNVRLQDAAFTSLQSWLYAGILSYGLKHTLGRYRPEEGLGANKFQPFSSHSSFPSGHTTAVFAMITPWVLYYPHPVTYGLFALGTGTAIARMARDKHWPTDVIAGAALGFLTGRYLSRQHLKLPATPALKLSTSATARGFVFAVKW